MDIKTVFMAAVDANRPLRRFAGFHSLLMGKGLHVDMLVVAEGDANVQVEKKVGQCSLVWVPGLQCMKIEATRRKVLERVRQGAGLLVTMVPGVFGGDKEAWDITHLNRISEPFGIRYTGTKVRDARTGHELTLGIECLNHPDIFENINNVSITSAWHLEVESPSRPLITGDENWKGISIARLPVPRRLQTDRPGVR